MSDQTTNTPEVAACYDGNSQSGRHFSGFEPDPLPVSNSVAPERNVVTDMQETAPISQVRR